MEVTDGEISAAQAELAREAGLFVEPSSAAAWAGILKDRANLDAGARVVVLLTGTGFKDTAAAEKLVSMPGALHGGPAERGASPGGFVRDPYRTIEGF